MNILVTGVAGLIGSRVADWILKNQPEVTVVGVDDLSGGYESNINEKVKFVKCNVGSSQLKEVFETHRFDYVFHFAAYAAEGLSPFIRVFNYQNNLLATANLVNQCISYNVKRLVFTSTMAVYGKGSPPFDEEHTPQPVDPYGIAKYACELDIQTAGDQHGLDWCIIRPHNVFGVNQNIWDKYRNVLGIWMYQHLNGEPLTIFGDGEQKRAFSFIDDSLASIWRAAISPAASKQIFNLGSNRYTRIKDACELLIDVMGSGEIKYEQARHEVKDAFSTGGKSERILGYEDTTDLRTGLTAMWNWAKKQPLRKRFEWESYEISRGMYTYWKTK